MNKVVVINAVGLSQRVLECDPPFLSKWMDDKSLATIKPVLPAVTCSVQTTYLTGKYPEEHGIVANGWFFRDECEVRLWRQSNHLVQSPSIWDHARKLNADFTCANMFWWYNMYSSVDYGVTPRPQYRANGLKIPDCYSKPAELRHTLQERLGTFPLFDFWGPKTSIKSSQWIADASKMVFDTYQPDLTLVYLPHLDYCLQKFGHDYDKVHGDILELDLLLSGLVTYYESQGVKVLILSEYGITDVNHPVHINRVLRQMGLIAVREENGLELLDAGMSKAFAVADHQIAHVYCQNEEIRNQVRGQLEKTEGIARVLEGKEITSNHLDHPRSGDLVVEAQPSSWFTYYYWLDDEKAPDFARMVDIHRKPGYDPVEMFLDPEKRFIIPRVAIKLLGKKLGFRTVMDLIPLDATLVKGSHGQTNLSDRDKAVFIGGSTDGAEIEASAVHDLLLRELGLI